MKSKKPTSKVKVLYQYLNGRWYAFADMGDDVFFGQVPVKAQSKKTEPKTAAKGKSPKKGPGSKSA